VREGFERVNQGEFPHNREKESRTGKESGGTDEIHNVGGKEWCKLPTRKREDDRTADLRRRSHLDKVKRVTRGFRRGKGKGNKRGG